MPTIQEMINAILASIPGAPFADTVDTIKTGDPAREVTGIVTTFLASQEVLQQAVDRGANFVITHEPTFYNHLDATDWLKTDAVYQAKRQLIDDHGLTLWRFHDYWHSHQPDGILTGVLRILGWEQQVDAALPYVVNLPPTRLADLVQHLKKRLGVQTARVIGAPEMVCCRVGLLVGAPGGESQIAALTGDIDVLVTGEIHEWETPEYVRDARYQGRQKALVILGHEYSEEAGMTYLAEWLQARFPAVPTTHIPTGNPFRFE